MYIYPTKPDEIYHYGIKRRSGRYPWGSGNRPYQRLEGKVSRMENRLKKRFSKSDLKTSKLQESVNKKLDKANAQRNSALGLRRKKSTKTFNEAYSLEEKKQRAEYKMSKTYEKYLNKFSKLDVKMDSVLQEKGLDYYNRVVANSNTQYKAALMKRVS